MTAPLLILDTLDDRREVHELLHRLRPGDRVRFLRWCCARVSAPGGNAPVPRISRELVDLAGRCDRADLRLTNTVMMDYWALVAQWNLDPVAAAKELEARVRRPASRPGRPSSAS